MWHIRRTNEMPWVWQLVPPHRWNYSVHQFAFNFRLSASWENQELLGNLANLEK